MTHETKCRIGGGTVNSRYGSFSYYFGLNAFWFVFEIAALIGYFLERG
jgi:hypothetical protein